MDTTLAITLWLLPILLAIPIGIVTNIITPRVQNRLATRSLSQTSKRINTLRSELEAAKQLNSDMNKLYLKSANAIFSILLFFLLGSIISSLTAVITNIGFAPLFGYSDARYNMFYFISSIGTFASVIPYLMAVTAAQNHIRLVSRVDKLDEYEKRIADQIEDLQRKTKTQQANATAGP